MLKTNVHDDDIFDLTCIRPFLRQLKNHIHVQMTMEKHHGSILKSVLNQITMKFLQILHEQDTSTKIVENVYNVYNVYKKHKIHPKVLNHPPIIELIKKMRKKTATESIGFEQDAIIELAKKTDKIIPTASKSLLRTWAFLRQYIYDICRAGNVSDKLESLLKKITDEHKLLLNEITDRFNDLCETQLGIITQKCSRNPGR